MAETHRDLQGLDTKGQAELHERKSESVSNKAPANKTTGDNKSDRKLGGGNLGPEGLNQ